MNLQSLIQIAQQIGAFIQANQATWTAIASTLALVGTTWHALWRIIQNVKAQQTPPQQTPPVVTPPQPPKV